MDLDKIQTSQDTFFDKLDNLSIVLLAAFTKYG